MVTDHVRALEDHLVADLLFGQGDEARALAVDEEHRGSRRLRERVDQRAKARRVGHEKAVRARDGERDRLAEAPRLAGEQGDAWRVGVERLGDELLGLRLDPGEIGGELAPRHGGRLAALVLHEYAHALPLVLVGPPRIEVHADHWGCSGGDPGQCLQRGRHLVDFHRCLLRSSFSASSAISCSIANRSGSPLRSKMPTSRLGG